MNFPINHESVFKIDSEGFLIIPDVWNKSLLMEWLGGGGYESVCAILNQHKKFKAENEKLKEQLNTIFPSKTEQAVISKYQVQRTNNLRTIEKLKAENEKLRERNLELSEEVEKCEDETIPKEHLTEYLDEGCLVAVDKDEYKQLKEENGKLSMKSKVQSDLINNLFAHIIREADIDDGISISDEYGCKYIDTWNKEYDELIKEHIETMNECELDYSSGVKIVFHSRDCIEFECVPESDDEVESDEESDELKNIFEVGRENQIRRAKHRLRLKEIMKASKEAKKMMSGE